MSDLEIVERPGDAPFPEAFGFDNTALSMFKECPKKYQLAMIEGLRPIGVAAPLAFGRAIHEVLEHFDAAIAKGMNREVALVAAVREAVILSEEGLGDDPRRTKETLLRAVIWYEENYRKDVLETIVLPNGNPATELTFRVELPISFLDRPVFYTGHIDKVVRYSGQLFAVERKHTTSALSDFYYDRYIFSSQISGYVLALQVNFNLEVGGGIVDSTQIGATFARFGRRVARRVPEHTQEWLADTLHWISRLEGHYKSDHWPHNTESCNKYGGCQFRDICFAAPYARKAVIKDRFRVEKWDPMKVRGEEE